MRALLLILCLLALSAPPAAATFTLIQHPAAGCGSTSACTVTTSSVGAGHLLVVMASGWDNIYILPYSSISCSPTCGTWVHPTAAGSPGPGTCGVVTSELTYTDCGYVLSSSAGATVVTVNWPRVINAYFVSVWEYSYSGTVAVDVMGSVDNGYYNVNPAGVPLTLTGSNDVVLQQALTEGTGVSAISAGYGDLTNVSVSFTYAASADLVNVASTAIPVWTSGGGFYTLLGAISFSETAGAPAPAARRILN